MDGQTYESLTRMERNCLRLARHDRKTEQIAHELGISASTVNTHIFSARRKLGGISRLAAADRLREFENGRPAAAGVEATDRISSSEDHAVMPASATATSVAEASSQGGAEQSVGAPSGWPSDEAQVLSAAHHRLSSQTVWMAPEPDDRSRPPNPTDVREVRAVFDFDDDRLEPRGRQDDRGDEVLRRIALVLAIAVLMALVAIAAPAIYDSAAMRIANSLERPHRR